MRKPLLVAIILLSILTVGFGQQEAPAEDTLKKDFKRVDIFPAISYSPETKLTLGVIGYYYMDLTKDDPNTLLSNINFLAVYTTAKQIAVESKWEIITNANKWRFKGELGYNHWPDRNYGLGNNPTALVQVADSDDDFAKKDTFNYLPYSSDRLLFAPVVVRKISKNIYFGLQAEIEYLFNEKNLKAHNVFLNADSVKITELPVEGLRSGIGIQLSLDSRDNVLNPLKGSFVTLGTLHNLKAFGSDYIYHSIRLDAREYVNTVKNHTLALRTVWNFRFSEDPIPIRGLSRVGGRDFVRGFFKGTYQDKHLASFEVEYRLPFWREDSTSPLIQFWKHLGIAVFAGTAQVAPSVSDISFNRFHSAVGAGLRILFNRESRVNLRIDFAIALDKNSDGPGKRQSGLYFFLGEAF